MLNAASTAGAWLVSEAYVGVSDVDLDSADSNFFSGGSFVGSP